MTPIALKTLRAQAGLTQLQLARLLCVHPVTIRKWEAGMQPMTASHDKLIRLDLVAALVRALLVEGAEPILIPVDSEDYLSWLDVHPNTPNLRAEYVDWMAGAAAEEDE